MTKTDRLAVWALVALLFTLGAYIAHQDHMTVKDAQTGNRTLTCVFADGERVVPPHLIKGNIDGTWIFANGSAKNCKLTKKVKR